MGEIGDNRGVEPLIYALTDSDQNVRRAAAKALVALPDARAVSPLIALLESTDPGTRANAAEALGRIGDPAAVDPLISALNDPDPETRREAVSALGYIGDARAVEPLIAALEDPAQDVRAMASLWLAGIADARAVEPLIAALRDPYFFVRHCAARALGEIGDARAVEPLIVALKYTDFRVRGQARNALKHLGDTVIASLQTASLRSPDVKVRSAAAEALIGETGFLGFWSPMIAALEDPDPSVRIAAAEALAITWNYDPEKEQERQDDGDDDSDTKRMVMSARETIVAAVSAALGDTDPRVREQARTALKQFGPMGTAALITDLLRSSDADDRKAGAKVLVRNAGFSESVELIVAALNDPDPDVRIAATEALAIIWEDHPEAERYDDGDYDRDTDQMVTSAGEVIVAALGGALEDTDHRIRERARTVLKQFGHMGTEFLITDLLRSSDADDRKVAVEALVRDTGLLGSYRPIIAALKDPDPTVRIAGAEALAVVWDHCSEQEQEWSDNKNDTWYSRWVVTDAREAIVAALTGALEDTDEGVRKAVKKTLEKTSESTQ